MLLLNIILRGKRVKVDTKVLLQTHFNFYHAYENNKVASKQVQVQEKETFFPLSNISDNIFSKN